MVILSCIVYKLLAVPDGAVLVIRSGGPGLFDKVKLQDFGPNTLWAKDLSAHESLKRIPVSTSIRSNTEWLFKRIIQKTGIGLSHKVTEFFEIDTGDSETSECKKPELSPMAHRMLGTLIGSLTEVARWRQYHQLLWDHLLTEESDWDGQLSSCIRPEHRKWTPYLAAFTSKDDNADTKDL